MPVRDILNAASSQGAGPSDPYFYDVSLLLNGDGTNGAQNNTFLDSSSNAFTITRNGNTTQGSFSPYGTLWSNYFNGSDAYLTAPNSTNWNISALSTYSVEAWICVSASGVQSALCGALNRWWFGYNFTDVGATANKFSFAVFNGATWQTISSTTTPSVGVWYHVAATFSSGTTKLYVNGTLENTGLGVAVNSSTGNLYVGAVLNPSYSYGFNGYLSNIRITNGGTLPYTGNFTPSTTPLTATSNTVFLSAQSNRFIDNSANNYTITANGSPSVQRFSPFNPTAPYDTATIGGSMYANDNGYLSSTGTLGLGTGDFTVEGWIYPTTYTYSNMIACIGDDQTSTGVSFYTYQNSMRMYNSTGSFVKTVSLNLNSWNHVAWVRQSGVVTFYFNGVSAGTSSFSSNISSSGFKIGADLNSGTLYNGLQGYMSDNRIANSAIYTTTFTPPTAPLSAVSGTQLLCNMTNAGIPDLAMQNDLQTVGSAQVSTSVKKYGTGSLSFDGSTGYLAAPNKPVYQLGSGDFTIECWINFSSLSTNRGILYFASAYDSLFSYGLQWSSNNLYFWYSTSGGAASNVSAPWTPSTSTWYHLAVTRNGSNLKFFIDGTQIGTTQSLSGVTLYASSANLLVGGELGGSGGSLPGKMAGYIDDLRITDGYARYTSNFTPPTAALPTY